MTVLIIAFCIIGFMIIVSLWFAMRPATLLQTLIWFVAIFSLASGTAWTYFKLGAFTQQSEYQFQLGHADQIKENIDYFREHPDELVAKLKFQVENHPDGVRGWMLLGKVYAGKGDFQEATNAFARALKLEPNDSSVILSYVEANAMAHQGIWQSQDKSMLSDVVKREPNNPIALNLLAALEYSIKNYAAAIQHWQQTLANLPTEADSDEMRTSIQTAIKKARNQLSPNSVYSISIHCELDELLKNRYSPDTQVLVYAKAQNGPPMPLAVVKTQIRALPTTITLSDDDAMIPEMTLSRFKKIILYARVSQHGQAQPEAGDAIGSIIWNGEKHPDSFKIRIQTVI